MKGINKLPIKILSERLAKESLPLSLEEFEEESKAISLGALSVYRRLTKCIDSNLHLVNLYFLSGKNYEQNIELNQKLLPYSRIKLKSEVISVSKTGIKGLNVNIESGAWKVVDGLIKKIEIYYGLCTKEVEYVKKLYAVFKITCIGCLNFPEILPIVLEKKIKVNDK